MKRIFKILLFIIIGLVFFVGILLFRNWFPRSEAFYVTNGDFRDFNFLSKLNQSTAITPLTHKPEKRWEVYPTKVHEIVSGSKIVFGFRYFQDVVPLAIDDEQFKKLTFSLPKEMLKSGMTYAIPDARINIVYSEGGSAWPESGCHGFPTNGRIQITEISSDKIGVSYHLGIDCKNYFGDPTDNRFLIIEDEDNFELLPLNDLNPYQGSPGTFPYDSTYRKGF